MLIKCLGVKYQDKKIGKTTHSTITAVYVHFPLDKIISFVYLSGEKWGGVTPAHRSCTLNLCILYTGARKTVQTGIFSSSL